MNKKAETVHIILSIIFIILIIAIIIIVVMIATKKDFFNTEDETPDVAKLTLFLKSFESNSRTSIDSNYVLDNGKVRLFEGNLHSDAYTPVEVPTNETFNLFCWSDKYYLSKTEKQITAIDKRENKSRLHCNLDKVGVIKVEKIMGSLLKKHNLVILNVSAENGWIYKLGVCMSWSAGIIDIDPKNEVLKCDKGLWKNYTKFYPENKTFEYLPDGVYLCGKDTLENCETVQSNRCKLQELTPPNRFKDKTDKCSYTGLTIKDQEGIELNFEIETLTNKNQLDFVTFIFFDHDRRLDKSRSLWVWQSEENGIDIASPDKNFRIDYVRN